ncbi:hypothetical protein [Schleiferilactobacillus perolens]|uniref:hypothetical protein n=1 Tax=Schleiferilactobacillus perolens TaxID=100468 RepID=UPI002354A960|nr:hypothetical protein [Schleiferilactobacillus perolens]MCI2170389.1 hypothetical protein [Schleiferilactobacillus perolens]
MRRSKKVLFSLVSFALLLTLGACGSGNKNASKSSSSKVKTEKVTKKKASKKSSSSSSSVSSADSSSSESSDSSASSSQTSSSSSSSSAASSGSATSVTTSDQATAVLKNAVAAKYQKDAPLVYAFIKTVQVNGQMAYQIEVGKNNGRSTIATYNVLADGSVQLVKQYEQ